MARNYSNIALDTTLAGAIGAGAPSLVVASAAGWPVAPFAAVIDPGAAIEEVVEVTVKVGTTFTITRGFDGTTAQAHSAGATVRHAAIAGDFTDLQSADSTHAALTTTAHGGIVASSDPRLSDARTPIAHAATHASAGSDPVTLAESQITNLVVDLAAKQTAIAHGRAVISGTTQYSIPGVEPTATATQVIAANIVRYCPILVVTPITIDQLMIEVTGAGAGGTTARLGIYVADTSWQPGALIVDAGTVAVDSLGVKAAGVGVTLQPGRYLTALNSDGAPTLRVVRGGGMYTGFNVALGATPGISSPNVAQAYGVFPGTGTAWTGAGGTALGPLQYIWSRISVP